MGVLQYLGGGESERSARKLQVLKSLSYLLVKSSACGPTARETGAAVMRVLTGKKPLATPVIRFVFSDSGCSNKHGICQFPF